jgi:deoxyribodipyrimidine photolyase-related protein
MIIFIIFPIHLYENIDLIKQINPNYIYLIEEETYFTKYAFHKAKLCYHRATMKFYQNYLTSFNLKCKYFDFNNDTWINLIKSKNVFMYDPIDHSLRSKIFSINKNTQMENSQSFMETLEELNEYRETHTNGKKYFHDASFYKWQRKRLNILIDSNGKPTNNKWSFDKDNRKPFVDSYVIPKILFWSNNYWIDAKKYINTNFPKNFGLIQDKCIFPLTFEQNKKHLSHFIKYKLKNFGTFEDAASSSILFGSHSLLSTSLNVGLITPDYIINTIIKWYHKQQNNYIQQVEAFVRQVIGWRSYVRFIYEFHGPEMFKENLLSNNKKLPKSWLTLTPNTGFDFIDELIIKTWDYGYLHHIERLMYIGNFSLLIGIAPKEIYKWFMICFMDSYEWVMVPNVFGMSQFSIESISMMTRPYFSSSAYIKRMSDFKSQDIIFKNINYKWEEMWNALYYNFIANNVQLLGSIYATALQVKNYNKLSKENKKNIIMLANKYNKVYIK